MGHWTVLSNICKYLVASLAIGLSCADAQATPITYTTSGTILSGTDYRGTYSNGEADRDLSGLLFSQSVTFDPTLVTPNVSAPPDYTLVSGRLYSGVATSTITIGNISNTYTLDASKYLYAQVALMNWLTQGDASRFDGVVFRTVGLTADYTSVDIGSNVYSSLNAFQLGLNINQNWSYRVKPDDTIQDANVVIYGPDGQDELHYIGRPETISMQVATAVPEPSTGVLLALGLATLLVLRRKS